ncbi:MAG: hypothetical protein JJT89_04850 [Nitriliruptoraceae bacterium]|nr:hypothetical protein [Nitriliruptoraceae bacterium]
MDETTRTRIDNYRPTVSLPDDAALDAVRDAVRRAEPDDADRAALLLHTASRHVCWATANGYTGDVRKLFSPACVAASVAAAEAASASSVSPYRSRLNRLCGAVSGRPPSARRRPGSAPSSRVSPRQPSAELSAIRVAARGMNVEEHHDLEAAMALGAGAGLVGPLASLVHAKHLQVIAGHVVACGPGFGPVVVREPWGAVILRIVEQRGDGPLTSLYTSAGRQRVERGLRASPHAPEFQAHRLRTGWITDLLSAGVPLDVVAVLAGITVASLHPYVALSEAPAQTTGSTPEIAPFTGLQRRPGPTTHQGHNVAAVIDHRQPQSAAVAAVWSSEEAEELRQLVRDRATTEKQAKNLLTALFVLLEWAIEQPGLPLRPQTLLKETTLKRWAAVQIAEGLADKSVAAYLSRLRRLSGVPEASGDRGRQPAAAGAYSEEERRTLIAASDPSASPLSERLRRHLAAHVHGQLGGGVSGHEVATTLGSDVQRTDVGIQLHVRGTPARLVPLHGPHADALARLAEQAPDETLTGLTGNDARQRHLVISNQLGFEFHPRRLQATWIVDRVRDGATAHELCLGTGLTLVAMAPQIEAAAETRPLAEVVAWSAWPATELRG